MRLSVIARVHCHGCGATSDPMFVQVEINPVVGVQVLPPAPPNDGTTESGLARDWYQVTRRRLDPNDKRPNELAYLCFDCRLRCAPLNVETDHETVWLRAEAIRRGDPLP